MKKDMHGIVVGLELVDDFRQIVKVKVEGKIYSCVEPLEDAKDIFELKQQVKIRWYPPEDWGIVRD